MAIDKKYISLDSFKSTLRDTFRKLMGQYWYLNANGVLKYGENENLTVLAKNKKSIEFIPQELLGSSALETNKTITVVKLAATEYAESPGGFVPLSEDEEYGILYEGTPQRKLYIRVSANLHHEVDTPTGYQTLTKFSDDVSKIFKNPIEGFYFEESFEYSVPDEDEKRPTLTSDYNFFVEEYESLTSTLQESVLPNFYALSLYEYDTTSEGDVGEVLGNLSGELVNSVLLMQNTTSPLGVAIQDNGVDPDDLGTTGINEYDYSLTVPYKDYLKEWPKAYTDLSFSDSSDLIEQGKNIIQTYSSYDSGIGSDGDKINHLNSRSVKMPYNIRLSMSSEGKGDVGVLDYVSDTPDNIEAHNVADTIGRLDLSSTFISHIISFIDPFTFSLEAEEQNYEFNNKTYLNISGEEQSLLASPILYNLDVQGPVEYLADKSFGITNKLFLDQSTVDEVDIAYALSEMPADDIIDAATQLGYYYSALHVNDTCFEYELAREGANVSDCRIYNGTFNRGDPAEDQTFAYRIKKYRGDTATGTPVQDIWIPNAVAQDGPIEYIDTQVRYGEQYTYDISALKYVFGMKYKYKQMSAPTIEQVESIFGTDGETGVIGYNFKWFGAKNLFDTVTLPESVNGPAFDMFPGAQVWEMVATYLSEWPTGELALGGIESHDTGEGLSCSDTFWVFNHFENASDYALPYTGGVGSTRSAGAHGLTDNDVAVLNARLAVGGDPGLGLVPSFDVGAADITSWPAWSPGNTRFFTLTQIQHIMEKAWYTKPTGRLDSGVGAGHSEAITYPSWYEMWGRLDWEDEWVSDDVNSGVPTTIKKIIRGNIDPAADDVDPAEFSLTDWFNLFMGHDSGGVQSGPISGQPTWDVSLMPQPMPPSHHRINGSYIPTAPDSDNDNIPDSGPNYDLFTATLGYYGKVYMGLELKGTEDLTTTPVTPGFHEGDLGIQELLAGEGAPIYETTGFTVDYEIDMYPSTRIVEAPYATLTTSVLSKPPPPPEIEIIPYRAVNNQLLFTFDATIAEFNMVAVPITQEDEALFEKHYQAQNPDDGKLLFKSDDIPAHFEVFRLDKPPNSYADFDGNLRATVSTLISNEDKIVRARSADYIENLQPNVKYYYAFRTVDFHGNVSNPTFIYEIELVDDGGAVYPLINLYQFPIIENSVASRTMKKLIQVYPALEQVTANLTENLTYVDPNDDFVSYEDPSDIPIGEVKLGDPNLEDSIWDKTFKIRLSSKKTGKKIDMNVTFKKKDERTTS